jgi:hypothetical protein
LIDFLEERRVLVCDGTLFGYPKWFRYSIPRSEDHQRFLELLAKFRSTNS